MNDAPVRRGPLQFGVVQSEWLYYQKWSRARHPRQCLFFDVPPVLFATDIGRCVSALVERHEVFRTTFHADEHGDPVQQVWPPRAVPLQEFDLFGPAPQDSEVDAFRDASFSIPTEWPLRAALVHHGARRRQILLVIANIAIDRWGQTILREELTELLDAAASGRSAALPAPDAQPIDQALVDAADEGAALRDHWRNVVSNAPSGVFPVEVIPERVRHTRARRVSPALGHAFRAIHEKQGLPAGPAFLTALAVGLATYCRQPVIPLSYTWPAREPAGTRRLVASVMRDLVLNIDLSGAPGLHAAAGRVSEAIERAAAHSRFDVLGLLEADSVINRHRGAWRRSAVFVNPLLDVAELHPGGAPALDTADVRRLVHEGETITETDPPGPYDDFNLYASVYLGEKGVPEVLISTNEAILTGAEAAALACGIERVLVEFALTGDVSAAEAGQLCGLSPRPLDEGWLSLDGSWFHLGLTERLLSRHPGVVTARVRAEPHGRPIAHVVTRPGGPLLGDLREFLLAHLDYRHGAVAPADFIVTVSPDAEPRDFPSGAMTFLEGAVRQSVEAANDLPRVDMSVSYVEAGGRLHRVPRVLARLHELGVHDFAAGDFLRPCSLRTLPAFLLSRREARREG